MQKFDMRTAGIVLERAGKVYADEAERQGQLDLFALVALMFDTKLKAAFGAEDYKVFGAELNKASEAFKADEPDFTNLDARTTAKVVYMLNDLITPIIPEVLFSKALTDDFGAWLNENTPGWADEYAKLIISAKFSSDGDDAASADLRLN